MPIVMKGEGGASRGFTLVEMSIVLVIIGLIIGGILKGQEIIASARQKAVINQVNAVRAAANTYFDRYRSLPGDDPAGNTVDANVRVGDGSGIVGGTSSTMADLDADAGNAGENYQFFNALIAANLLNGGQVTASTVTSSSIFGKSALPAAPITGAGMTVVYGTHGGLAPGGARSTHWVRVHKDAAAPAEALSPRTMANIDNQVDDGLAGGGGVRSTDDGSATACNSTGGVYTASDNITCIALFEVTQ